MHAGRTADADGGGAWRGPAPNANRPESQRQPPSGAHVPLSRLHCACERVNKVCSWASSQGTCPPAPLQTSPRSLPPCHTLIPPRPQTDPGVVNTCPWTSSSLPSTMADMANRPCQSPDPPQKSFSILPETARSHKQLMRIGRQGNGGT